MGHLPGAHRRGDKERCVIECRGAQLAESRSDGSK